MCIILRIIYYVFHTHRRYNNTLSLNDRARRLTLLCGKSSKFYRHEKKKAVTKFISFGTIRYLNKVRKEEANFFFSSSNHDRHNNVRCTAAFLFPKIHEPREFVVRTIRFTLETWKCLRTYLIYRPLWSVFFSFLFHRCYRWPEGKNNGCCWVWADIRCTQSSRIYSPGRLKSNSVLYALCITHLFARLPGN